MIRRLLPALLAGLLLLPAPGYGQGLSKVRQLLGQGWTFLEAGNLTKAEEAFTAAFEDPVGRNSAEVYYAIAAVWWERRNAMAAYMWLSDASKARKDSFTWDGGPGDEWDQRIDARQRYVESNFTVIKLRATKRGKPLPPLADPTPQDPLLREFTDRLPRVVNEGVEAKMAVHWVLLPNGTYWIGEELVELGGGQLDPTKAASWELPGDRGKAKAAYAERFAALQEGRSMAGEATVAEAEAAVLAEQQRKDEEAAAAQLEREDADRVAQEQAEAEAARVAQAEQERAERVADQEREEAEAAEAERAAVAERAEEDRLSDERERRAEADRLEQQRRDDARRAEQDRKDGERLERERRDAEEREERALAAERRREDDRRIAGERRADRDAQAAADREAAEEQRAARRAAELEEARQAEAERALERESREADAASADERRREREAREEEALVAEARQRQEERDEAEAEARRREDEKWANAARETEEAEARRSSADAQARADAPTANGDAAEELRGRRFYIALGGGMTTVERLEGGTTSAEATWAAHGELGAMIPLGKGALPVALAVGLSYDSLPMSGCSHAQSRGHAVALHIAPRLAVPIKGRTWLQGRAGLHIGAAANIVSDGERQGCAEQRSGDDIAYGVRLQSAGGASTTVSYGDLGWDGYGLVVGPDFEVGILGAPGAAPLYLGAAFFLRHDQVFAAIEGGEYHLRTGDTSGVELETVELSALDASASMPRFQLGARATVLF